jgi:hypothetical protein
MAHGIDGLLAVISTCVAALHHLAGTLFRFFVSSNSTDARVTAVTAEEVIKVMFWSKKWFENDLLLMSL